ncbi:EmrB/QacA subfamily drug resistance transporter [Nakamurella sp. UYEF19]|uniref:DHA2 family efflux MFS transporter permease subunit n=1 Tax=Nakamurella sp. UYEF19 TaxID=1756392 RepID=UPI00339ACC07
MTSQTTTDLTKSGAADALDPRRWIALIVIGAAQLMVVLDATIVNVALPTAATALKIGPADLQWVITAYALPFGALLLLGGRIADYVGRKKILMISLAGFAIASAIGGAANGEIMLFAARALQGAFAAMLAPATLSMLNTTFRDPKERAKAFATFGAIAGGGAAVGLVLGGVLTDGPGWRWCLFVNIPISIAVIIGARFILTESKTEQTGGYDVAGAVLATFGLGSLVWGFNQAAKEGWGSYKTFGFLILAVVLLIAFVLVEQRIKNPLLPMRIVLNRNRGGSYLVGLLVGTGLFAVFLFLTLFLQDVKGYSPTSTGLAFLPFSAGVIVGAGVGSQLVLRVGAKIVIPAGLALGVAGLLLLAQLTPTSGYAAHLLPALLLISVGMGFIFMSTTNVALHGVSVEDSGVASAMVNTTQQVGGSLGTALLTTFFASALAKYAGTHPPTGSDPASVKTAINAASVHGYTVAFYWAAAFFAAAAVASLLLINAGKHEAEEAEPVMHIG